MWNNGISISVFGESHGNYIGAVAENFPCGYNIDLDELSAFLMRRSAKNDGTTTKRVEDDNPQVISGIYNEKTTGAPLAILIKNENQNSDDYDMLKDIARPSHSDYTAFIKYKGNNDARGGGHFSGRLTAPIAAIGGIAKQILAHHNIFVGAHILSLGGIFDQKFDNINLNKFVLDKLAKNDFSTIDNVIGEKMSQMVKSTQERNDSIGAKVECAIIGMPAGIGGPLFDGLESVISSIIFAIGGVKGIEFGSGFSGCDMFGSQNNDNFIVKNEKVEMSSNNHGGILGGISSGMPIIFNVAIKPTPSIATMQDGYNLQKNQVEKISIKGRHDPCIALRATCVVESCAAIAVLGQCVKAGTI
ncbi:MAG: chorismate synthase [Oscillospiraceae bacterium]